MTNSDNILEVIPEKGILWTVHKNGQISRQTGNYKPTEPPQIYEYPEFPEKGTKQALTNWYDCYEMAEQQNYLFAQKWLKLQHRKLSRIKATYRNQKIRHSINSLLQKIFNNSKQR